MAVDLATARAALGREIGGFGTFVAETGSDQDTIVCTTAFSNTDLPTTALAYRWAFVPTSVVPRQRQITGTGLIGSSGTIALSGLMGTAIANGTIFELHTMLPAVQTDGNFSQATAPGLHECLNWALRHLLTPQHDYAITLVNGQRDYDLPVWLDRPERLIAVRQPNALGNDYVDADRAGHPYEIRESSDGPVLHFDAPYRFTSGSYALRLQVLRPADTWIKVSGVWADSTTGLVDEDDEAGPPVNDIVTVALVLAYEAIRNERHGRAKGIYDALHQRQLVEARKVRYVIDLPSSSSSGVGATEAAG